jgi:transglutaminase-like putative cysteine protease
LGGKIFVRYTPEGWRSDASKSRELLPDVWSRTSKYRPEMQADAGGYFSLVFYQKYLGESIERMHIIMGTQTHRTLFIPYNTIGLQSHLSSVFCDRHGAVYRQASLKGIEYSAYYIPERTANKLKSARKLTPGVVNNRQEALAIPQNLRQSLTELAQKYAGDAVQPLEQAKRIKSGLEREYRYSRNLVSSEGFDPVFHFLFRSKQGNCEMFASAMALLLRARGLPSRYVTGFLMREKNFLGNYYIVREQDAHAWTETYVPEHGWIPFDATPSVMDDRLESPGIAAILTESYDFLRMKWQELRIKTKTLEWGALFTWLVNQLKTVLLVLKSRFLHTIPLLLVFLLIFLVFVLHRRNQNRKGPAPDMEDDSGHGLPYPVISHGSPELEQVRKILAEFEEFLRESGHERRPSQTLLEFMSDLEDSDLDIPLRDYGNALVASFHQCRYGNSPVSAEQIAGLSDRGKKMTK